MSYRTCILAVLLPLCLAAAAAKAAPAAAPSAAALYERGSQCYQECNYALAMEYFLTSLETAERQDDPKLMCSLYKDMGNVYSIFGDYERSRVLYKKALAIAAGHRFTTLANKLRNNLICSHIDGTPLDDSRRYYAEMERDREKRPRYPYDLLICRGMILWNGHRTDDSAIALFRQAAHYSDTHGLGAHCTGQALSVIAQIHLGNGRRDSAVHYLKICERLARSHRQTNLLISVLKDLCAASAGDEALVCRYKAEYLDLTDSVYNRSDFNHLKNAQFLYETRRDRDTITRLETDREKQRIIVASLAAGLVLLVSLLLVVAIQKRRLKASYKALFERSQHDLETSYPPAANAANAARRPATAAQSRPAASATASGAALLQAVTEALDRTEDICDPDFCIDSLAKLVGSNSKYVSQIINEAFGKNFRSLLGEYRIKEAMRRMNDDDNYGRLTIKAIAESVGYKSQANFIAVFTRITGIKPSIYQRLLREKEEKDY